MHRNSLEIVREFIKNYLPDRELQVLDLGSRVMPHQVRLGSYRQFFTNKKWQYVGADIEAGENVDVVMTDGYKIPFNSEEFDVVISGQTIEHVEYPWFLFEEIARVLKKDGLCCIIAPAVIHEHKYPLDTYRYYPDGMKALAKWSHLNVLDVFLKEHKKLGDRHHMLDCCLIAKKP